MLRALLLLAIVFAPSGTLADVNTGSLTVTFSGRLIERTLAGAMVNGVDKQTFSHGEGRTKIKGVLRCSKADCRPESLAKDDGRIRAAYKLKVKVDNLPNISATFDLMFGLSCDVMHKTVTATVSISSFRLHLPRYLNVPFLAGIVESVLTRQMTPFVDDVNNEMWKHSNASSFAVPACPHTIAKSGGDLTMDFTAGTQCTDGQTRDLPCSGRMTGTNHQVCNNGWWWGTSCLDPEWQGPGNQP
jgi:hypothetical protein